MDLPEDKNELDTIEAKFYLEPEEQQPLETAGEPEIPTAPRIFGGLIGPKK